MKKGILISFITVCSLFFFISGNAFGFGMPKIGGSGSKTPAPTLSLADAENMQGDMLKQYGAACQKNTEAQMLMAKAFGMKEEAEAMEAQKKAFESGNVMNKDELEKQRALSEATQDKINEKMDKEQELSAEGKKYYGQSLIPFFQAVLLYKDTVTTASKTLDAAKQQVETASLMNKMKVKKTFDTTLYLAPKLPGDVKGLSSTGSKYITYAKKNEVQVPKDASDALGDL